MTDLTAPGYVLLDPRPTAAESPYTFFLPSETEIMAIANGDFAKLMFEHVPAGKEWGVERMWVAVEDKDGDELWGRLASSPYEPTARIQTGDPVRFAPYHVIGITWSRPEAAPSPVQP